MTEDVPNEVNPLTFLQPKQVLRFPNMSNCAAAPTGGKHLLLRVLIAQPLIELLLPDALLSQPPGKRERQTR